MPPAAAAHRPPPPPPRQRLVGKSAAAAAAASALTDEEEKPGGETLSSLPLPSLLSPLSCHTRAQMFAGEKKSVVVRISRRRRLSSLARTHTVARWNFLKVCSFVHSEILAGDNTKFLRHPPPLFFHPKEGGKGRKTLPSLEFGCGEGVGGETQKDRRGIPSSCSSSAGFLAASLPKRRRRQLQRESGGMSVGSAAAAVAAASQ